MTALTASLAAVDRVRRGLRRRALLVAAAMTIVLLVAATLALGLGDYPMDPGQVLRTLVGGGTRIETYIVWETRMPRFAMAVVAGGALALAGALLQALLRNPLASPDLLGISGGARCSASPGRCLPWSRSAGEPRWRCCCSWPPRGADRAASASSSRASASRSCAPA
ncbi:iron chelate uptake ABC transporter family permease subunit [Microbacterium sp. SCN 71-21]|uniref:iron chelate uptake ABC transporter family permease subunit n=1 Tax=Microbacterium sp. SCN 71-21 TaxID=1660116 RepID=UPI000AD630A1|nr:iron chelate uptake ABC transporter family permease subunit [Microbacterium sp. SCN 71-21]